MSTCLCANLGQVLDLFVEFKHYLAISTFCLLQLRPKPLRLVLEPEELLTLALYLGIQTYSLLILFKFC